MLNLQPPSPPWVVFRYPVLPGQEDPFLLRWPDEHRPSAHSSNLWSQGTTTSPIWKFFASCDCGRRYVHLPAVAWMKMVKEFQGILAALRITVLFGKPLAILFRKFHTQTSKAAFQVSNFNRNKPKEYPNSNDMMGKTCQQFMQLWPQEETGR